MTSNDSRRGASNLGIPLMIVAFLLMGGLIYWLSISAEPTEVAVIEEEEPEDVFLGTVLDAATLETPAITGYEGMTVRVADLSFAQAVGSAQFFVSLPQGSPFLVRFSDEMIANSAEMPSGFVTVTGILQELTDSIRDAWESEGTVDAGNRPLVDFAAHFIQAREITTGAPPSPADTTSAAGGGA